MLDISQLANSNSVNPPAVHVLTVQVRNEERELAATLGFNRHVNSHNHVKRNSSCPTLSINKTLVHIYLST